MAINAKYVHTNIVARDWRRLSRFYQEVFGCTPIPPERDYSGDWIQKVTGVEDRDITIRGQHLRLPGYGPEGPTIEIFEYSRQPERPNSAANLPGFAHIAFHVDDVANAREVVLREGGRDLGSIHSMEVSGAGTITLIYMTDPEGNIVELQRWTSAKE